MRKLYMTLGVLCMIMAGLCIYKALPARPSPLPPTVEAATKAVAEQSRHSVEGESVSSGEPVDFEELRKINPDIYAWLYIPGTDINHPVLQSLRGDNDFYLDHRVDLQPDENGCLFTEYLYNSKDFEDPVTVIYGHRMRSNEMFGQLESLYSAPGGIEDYDELIVYLPGRELHYRVFAAVPYENLHILNYYRRFDDTAQLTRFVEDVSRVRSFSAQFDSTAEITPEDKLLVLSTCLAQNDEQRFLVLAKRL